MKLEPWIKRHIIEVDQDGECVEKVQLSAVEGSLWDTWQADYIRKDPSAWVQETEALQAEIADQLPRGAHQFSYIGYNQRGEIRTQCTVTIHGKNQRGSRSLVGGESQALAQSMGAIASTVERTLATANSQLEFMQRQNEIQARHLAEFYEHERRRMQIEALEHEQNTAGRIPDELQSAVIEQLPKILDFLQFITAKKAPASAAAPTTPPAVNAAPTTNGAN